MEIFAAGSLRTAGFLVIEAANNGKAEFAVARR
jgi:hypothetical protein